MTDTKAPELTKWVPPRAGYTLRLRLRWVRSQFLRFSVYRDVRFRQKMTVEDRCEWCSAPFADSDMLALACPEQGRNMLLCQSCAASAGGDIPAGGEGYNGA